MVKSSIYDRYSGSIFALLIVVRFALGVILFLTLFGQLEKLVYVVSNVSQETWARVRLNKTGWHIHYSDEVGDRLGSDSRLIAVPLNMRGSSLKSTLLHVFELLVESQLEGVYRFSLFHPSY